MLEVCYMNYLAHLVLSGDDASLRLGNFIGDAVKGDPQRTYAPAVARGIHFHRWIDSYADSAPESKSVRAALRPVLGRFSAVGVDLLYDHFLASNFAELHPAVALPEFAQTTQQQLLERIGEMPERSQRFLRAMVAHNWLVGYASRAGMLEVCRSMDARLEQRLGVAKSPLHRLFEAADGAGIASLEEEFKAFWERFQDKAQAHVASHDLPTFTAWQLK